MPVNYGRICIFILIIKNDIKTVKKYKINVKNYQKK